MTDRKRTMKTPTEKAVAALGVATRAVDKLEAKRTKLNAELAALVDDLTAAKARRDYLAQNPDLPEADTDPIPGVDPVEKPRRRAVRDEPQA